MLLYAIVKYLVYVLWCYIGLHLFTASSASLIAAIKYGAIRWLLGLLLGVLTGIALGSISSESVGFHYILVYTPLRIIEWGIVAALIVRASKNHRVTHLRWRIGLWIVGGIIVSFASDLTSPEGLAGKFCIGRCLC